MTLSARQMLLRQRFETARESFLRYYRNAAQDQPYETADYYVRQARKPFFCGGGVPTGRVMWGLCFVTSVLARPRHSSLRS